MTSFDTLTLLAISLIALPNSGLAETLVISQAEQAFSQTDLSVKAGDHIRFLNQDDVNHNIVVQADIQDDDDGQDKGVQSPGTSVDVLFDKVGRFKVRCHIHPNMKLRVDVR